MKIPQRPSVSEAQAAALALCDEFGLERALKRCAQERALARRARSRKRFGFWTEVAKFIETIAATSSAGTESDALEVAAVAERIAELTEAFATMAQDAGLSRIAQLLTLARAHADNEAKARAPRSTEPAPGEPSGNAEDSDVEDDRDERAPERMAHFRRQRENLSRFA